MMNGSIKNRMTALCIALCAAFAVVPVFADADGRGTEGERIRGRWVSEDMTIEFNEGGSFAFTDGEERTTGNYEMNSRSDVCEVNSEEKVLYITDGQGGTLTPLYITEIEQSGDRLVMGLMFRDGSGRQVEFTRAG